MLQWQQRPLRACNCGGVRVNVMRAIADRAIPTQVADYWLARLPHGVARSVEFPRSTIPGQPPRPIVSKVDDAVPDGDPADLEIVRVELSLDLPIRTQGGLATAHFYRVGWNDEAQVVVVAGPARRRELKR